MAKMSKAKYQSISVGAKPVKVPHKPKPSTATTASKASKAPTPKPQAEGLPAREMAKSRMPSVGTHEVIAVSLAKSANGEVLRWRINEANGELIVLLKDGRKLYGRFD